MSRPNLLLPMCLCVVVGAAAAPDGLSRNGNGAGLNGLPDAVRATIVQLSEGGRVTDVRPQQDRGRTYYYDVGIEKKGRILRYRITSDGAVMGLSVPSSEGGAVSASSEVSAASEGPTAAAPPPISNAQLQRIPAAAREALLHRAGGEPITTVEIREIDDEKVYVGCWRAQEKQYRAGVSGDGTLVMWDESVAATDVPAAVRRAAAKLFRKDAAPEYEQRTVIYYVVRGRDDKKTKEAVVSALGHVEQKPKEVKPRHSP